MSFNFTKNDRVEQLPDPIKAHFPTFVQNRLNQLSILTEAVEEGDFEEIRLFCHAQLGVAGSYNCFKLEEITLYIQDYARKEVMEPIKSVLPVLENYLGELKNYPL